jgi:hypothetical protein
MDQMSLGQYCYYTVYNTSWTDTTTSRGMIGLLVNKIEDGLGYGRANFNLGGLA